MSFGKNSELSQFLAALGTSLVLMLASIPAEASVPPTVSVSGGDITVSDSDGAPGETVTLTATASDPDGSISDIQWFDGMAVLGNGNSISVRLDDGAHSIWVIAIDNSGDSSDASATITVSAPVANVAPSVSIDEGDRTVRDSDGVAGETVTVTATAADTDGTIATVRWYLRDVLVGTGTSAAIPLNDGENVVTVTVTDDDGAGASTSATITVRAVGVANQKPVISNVNYSAEIADSDLKAGETTDLSITATDSDGSIASITWRVNDSTTLTGSSVSAALTDGSNTVVVTVTDNEGATVSQTLAITVTKPPNKVPVFSGYEPRSLVPDSDLLPGETVYLSAGAADLDGVITGIEVTVDGSVSSAYTYTLTDIVNGFTVIRVAGLRLEDGVHTISLTLIDNEGGRATETDTITIQARPVEPTVREVIEGVELTQEVQINLDFINAERQVTSSFKSGEEVYAMLDVALPKEFLQQEVHAYLYLKNFNGEGLTITSSGEARPDELNGTRFPAAIYNSAEQSSQNFSVAVRLDRELVPGSYGILAAVSINRSDMSQRRVYNTGYVTFSVSAADVEKPVFRRLESFSPTGGDEVFESRIMNQHGESKREYIYGEDIISVNLMMYPAKKYIEEKADLASNASIYKVIKFNDGYYVPNAKGGWLPTDLNPIPVSEQRALDYVERWDLEFDTVGSRKPPPGDYAFYMGYEVEGEISYHTSPVSFKIVEKD